MREESAIRIVREGMEEAYEKIKKEIEEGKIPDDEIHRERLACIFGKIQVLKWVLGERRNLP